MASVAVPGYCLKCRARCGVLARIEDGRLTGVEADPGHPNGGICAMGRAEADIAHDPRRLRHPLRRTSPKDEPAQFRRISWDEALDEIVERMQAIAAEHGPEAVAFSRPTPSANASADWQPYLVRLANAFGTPNQHETSYLCSWNREQGLSETYGTALPPLDMERSAVIVIVGHNPALTNPQTLRRLRAARERGAKVVLVDPRRTETVRFADLWLAPRYGTDGALVLGAIRSLIARDAHDASFAARWTNAPFLVDRRTGRLLRDVAGRFAVIDERGALAAVDPTAAPDRWGLVPRLDGGWGPGEPPPAGGNTTAGELTPFPGEGADTAFRLLREGVAWADEERVAAITGIGASDLRRFAELLSEAPSWSYYTWNGWEQHTNAFATHRAMAILYALSGSFGRPGGNVVRPSLELADLTGSSLLDPAQAAKRVGLDVRPIGVPATSGVAYFFYRSILEGVPYRLRALLSFGSNMLLQNPDVERGRAALQQLDFHVHIDQFASPMSEVADLVLPAAAMWESPGLRMGFDGSEDTAFHVQYRPPALAPAGEARPDIEIIFELARRLGYADAFWGGDVDAAFDARLAPHGLDLVALRAAPGGVRLDAQVRYASFAEEAPATGRVRGFATRTGKLEVYAERLLDHGYEPLPTYQPPRAEVTGDPAAEAAYPLVLSSRKLATIAHSQHRGVARLRRRWPEPFVEVHPRTARAEGLADGEMVRVETPTAAMTVRLKVSERILEGAVVGQAGWWEACEVLGLPGQDPFADAGANINRLVASDVADEVSGGLPVKSARCRLRPAPVSPGPPPPAPAAAPSSGRSPDGTAT